MKLPSQLIGKSLYAIIFLILIPVGLFYWAKYTEGIISFLKIESKTAGSILVVLGGALMLWAMFVLKKNGKGLPMNAYPPSVFVMNGPYRIFKHPIYWGFGILLIGFSIFKGSASGLWLVSPVAILGMIALVLGYEAIDLKRRFPYQKLKTVLDLPENNIESPALRDRFASLICIVTCLIISNFITSFLCSPSTPLWGKPLDIFQGLQNPYLSYLGFIFLILIPFVLKKKNVLREWEISGFFSISIFVFFALIYPSLGFQGLAFSQSVLFTVPVFLIFISLKSLFRQSVRTAIAFTFISVFLVFIQLINSRSALLHLADSVIIFLLASNYLPVWLFLKNTSEKMANSWKEWIFGKVRVINHGIYVGVGTFFGVFIAGTLAGKEYSLALLVFTIIVTISSALWAQLIEGSEKLKRPFGYYGGLVGIIFGSIAVWVLGYNGWVIIGVVSVVMPWVQATGRLRCLVNGCCHGGRINNPLIGIRYFHPRSRVCNISGLKGELVHPTQLYSIIWLFVVGILIFTLWHNSFSSPFIFGIYLILTGLGRFVEEAYRGESQTVIIKNLRLYQWTAIISVFLGIFMTVIQIEPAAISPGFSWESFFTAFISGLFIFFVMGVDFPFSNARFSRLV